MPAVETVMKVHSGLPLKTRRGNPVVVNKIVFGVKGVALLEKLTVVSAGLRRRKG